MEEDAKNSEAMDDHARSLRDWLVSDKEDISATMVQRIHLLSQCLQNPSSDVTCINGRLFHVTTSFHGDLRNITLSLDVREVGGTPAHFAFTLGTSLGYNTCCLAANRDEILAQIYGENVSGKGSLLSVILNTKSLVHETLRDVPEMAQAALSWDGSLIVYLESGNAALAGLLNRTSGMLRMIQLTPFQSWPSALTFDPRPEKSTELTYVTCQGSPWKHGAEGFLTRLEVMSPQPEQHVKFGTISTEILQFSSCGRLLLTYRKLPTSFILLDSSSLTKLYAVDYQRYCSFVDLPLRMPDSISKIQDSYLMRMFPAVLVVIRENALVGSSLRGDAVAMVMPMFHPTTSSLVVAHIYVTDSPEKSEVEVHDLSEAMKLVT